jgi:hypothetical protein
MIFNRGLEIYLIVLRTGTITIHKEILSNRPDLLTVLVGIWIRLVNISVEEVFVMSFEGLLGHIINRLSQFDIVLLK